MSLTRILTVMLTTLSLVILIGCSSGYKSIDIQLLSSSELSSSGSIYQEQSSLGHFSLTLDSETVSAIIEPINREPAMDVTGFVNISIRSIVWDPVQRIWEIVVDVQNPSPFTGFGPWVVFTETGYQKILDQDGFVWIPGPTRRVPVVAFAKDNDQRAFSVGTTEQFDLRIHWPVGWDSFSPLNFFIDASFPGARQQPIIEQLHIQPTVIPENFIITAWVKDWQKDNGIQYVWVDLRPIGGPQYHQMFDDGNHGDGGPNDDIYGNSFMAIVPDPPVVLPVHAIDTEGYRFENDIIFGHTDQNPCVPQETIAKNDRSKIVSEKGLVSRTENEWISLWNSHSDNPGDRPFVDFERNMVIAVFMGERSSLGHSVDIECVRFIWPPFENMINVDYVKNIPDRDTCITQPAMSYPFHFIVVPKYMGADNFIGQDKIYYCD